MAKITFENSSSSSSSSWSILTSSNTSHSIFNKLINIVFMLGRKQKEKKENCSVMRDAFTTRKSFAATIFFYSLSPYVYNLEFCQIVYRVAHASIKEIRYLQIISKYFFSLLQSSIWFWNYFLSFPINSNFIEKIFAIHLL